MANPIQIKRSSTASAVPAAGSLLVGELAVNLVDKKLYTKNGGGTVIMLAQPTPGTASQLLASDGSGGYAAVTVGSGLSFSGGTLASTSGGGSVTSISVVTANGVSGTVANASSTPAITLSLGAINPTSVGATTPGTGVFSALTTSGSVKVTGAAATGRSLKLQTAGVDRWDVWATNAAESGSDAGSVFAISYYSDAGAYKSDALQISRVDGSTMFPEKLVTLRQNDSREVVTTGLYMNQIAVATVTYDQYSPSIHLKGDGWYTSGASRKNCHWWVTVKPEQGTSNPTNALVFESDTSDTPTGVERVRFTDSGVTIGGVSAVAGRLIVHHNDTNAALAISDSSDVRRVRFDSTYGLIFSNSSGVDTASISNAGAVTAVATSGYYLGSNLFALFNSNQTKIYSGSSGTIICDSTGATAIATFSTTGLAVTGNISASATGQAFVSSGATTAARYLQFGNTGGQNYFGIDDSTGASLASGLAYSAVIYGATGVTQVVAGSVITKATSSGLAVMGKIYSTVADSTYGLYAQGATGKLRFLGYAGGNSYIEAVNAAENAYQPIVIAATTTTISNPSVGTQAVFSGTGLAVTGQIRSTSYLKAGVDSGSTFANGRIYCYASDGNAKVYFDGVDGSNFIRRETDGQSLAFYRAGTQVGRIDVTTTATSYVTSSDARLKTNIRDYDSGSILDLLKPRIFDWKTGEKDSIGFIAQELYAVYPQAVSKGDDGEEITQQWGVDFSKLVPVLVAELKSLRARVKELESHA